MSTASLKRRVPGLFDGIASTYDLLTGANPGYRAHLEASARRMQAPPEGHVLDLCCGTGASTAAVRAAYPHATITGLDLSEGMLSEARKKTELEVEAWIHGDATDPAAYGATGPYDAILMAYGIRNVPEPDRCLDNLAQLVRPGGRIVFHEYSVSDSTWATIVWTLVCWLVIIPGGLLTARDTAIYRYLWRSALDFDGVSAFEDRLRAHGFTDVHTVPMGGWQRGIVHSFVATVPDEAAGD